MLGAVGYLVNYAIEIGLIGRVPPEARFALGVVIGLGLLALGEFVRRRGSPGAATWGTKQVGLLLPNALGLHDMLGNVWEWCQDRGGAYSAGAQTNPMGPATGGTRVLRGGNWFNIQPVVRCSVRFDTVPSDQDIIGAGVRPARTP